MKATRLETERFYLDRLTIENLSQDYSDWMNDIEVNQLLESGGNVVATFNTSSIGYSLNSTDEITAIGKFT